MKSPVKITVVTSVTNLKRIKELYNQVEADVRPLHTGFTSGGSIIWEDVDTPFTRKLPINLRLIISRCLYKQEWDSDVLLRAFHSKIEARER